MRVLITGATGFIGSNVAKKIKQSGHEVFILVREKNLKSQYKVIEYEENLAKLIEDFRKVKFDLVIHCASLFIAEHKTEDIDNLIKSNILLITHILEAMKVTGTKKIINTSTSWQHYNDEGYNPVCLYAATKQAAEDIIKFYCEASEIDSITLTIFDSYGPNDRRKKLISLLKETSHTNNKLDLSLGEQYVDYIYIDDIVDAYIQSTNMLNEGEVQGFNKYYLNSDTPLQLKEIIKIYEQVYNTKLNINFGGRPYRKREVMNTYKKGQRLPNWYPKYTYREGLEKIKNEEENI